MTTLTAATAAVKSSSPVAAAGIEPGESLIDRDSHFNGLYETKQNLRIEGLAEGEIQCEGTLTVAEGARVKAKVTASTITIAGELDGEVLCHGVFQIMPSGQVAASVSARRLIVQEGGLYNGDFRMITDGVKPASFSASSVPGDGRLGATDGSSLDALSTEDWWRKLTTSDTAEQDGTEQEPSDSEEA
jgi:cytoskeletal protein CcmA (bactofilin family)